MEDWIWIPAPFTALGRWANNLTSHSPNFLTCEMRMVTTIFQQSAWPVTGDSYLLAPCSPSGGPKSLGSLNVSTSPSSTFHFPFSKKLGRKHTLVQTPVGDQTQSWGSCLGLELYQWFYPAEEKLHLADRKASDEIFWHENAFIL